MVDITNITINDITIPQSYSFEEIVLNYCTQWKNYTFYAHDFYMICIGVYISCGLLRNFYDKSYKQQIVLFQTDKWYLKHFSTIDIDFNVLKMIQEIALFTLILRIINVYFVWKIQLGGI